MEAGMRNRLKQFPILRSAYWRLLRVRAGLLTLWWGLLDTSRYVRANHYRTSMKEVSHLKAEITKAYHSLEKGLSMPQPRTDFGVGVAVRLADMIDRYGGTVGWDEFLAGPIGTIGDYLGFKNEAGKALARLAERHAEWLTHYGEAPGPSLGGVCRTSSAEISRAATIDFESFLEARHSVRHFAGDTVSSELLLKACRMAQLAPSACNRQGARAYVVCDPDKVQSVLAHQPGNRGFGHHVPAVIVVAGRLDAFGGPEERKQAIVDGSLFAMTLVYSLHSLGLGTCMLAWCVSPSVERSLAKLVRMNKDDAVVTLIAVGHIPESLNVPVSQRVAPSEAAVLVS